MAMVSKHYEAWSGALSMALAEIRLKTALEQAWIAIAAEVLSPLRLFQDELVREQYDVALRYSQPTVDH